MAEEPGRMQQYRGSDADRRTTTFRAGELAVTTDTDHLGNYVVVGDDSTAGGLDISVGNAYPGWPSSRWITNSASLLAPTAATTVANFIVYAPICVPAGPDRLLAAMGINVPGAGGGGEGVRLGLYQNANGRPTARVYATGAMSVASAGFKQPLSAGSPTPLRPGWYWTAFLTDSTTATFDSLNTTGYASLIAWFSTTYKRPTVWYQAFTYGNLPASASPAGVINGAFPLSHILAD